MKAIQLGDIHIEVRQKDIKNVHLSVHPPDGAVRISAPAHMDPDTIRVYAISKLSWIKKQQAKLRAQARETEREFLDRESHYFLGERYLLRVEERDEKPKVLRGHGKLTLRVRPGASTQKKQAVLEAWYRSELRRIASELVVVYEKRMGRSVAELRIKKMKTKWGTCNIEARRIWLNLELVKKPPACIEYIVVHELVHLFERNHNERFVALMDKYLPEWRVVREELNRLPVGHVVW